MIEPIAKLMTRADSRLVEDAFGVVALVVILVGGLHVPALI